MSRAEAVPWNQKFLLALECGALFLGVPTAVATHWIPVPVIPVLLVMAAGCWFVLRWRHKVTLRSLLRTKAPKHEWRRILIIYLIATLSLVIWLWLTDPAAMFFLLRRHFGFWLLIMFGYPVLSVLPQELVYRAFFFERYRPLFGRGIVLVVANAIVFGFGHIVFNNSISMVLTFLGGLLFTTTYKRTSSLITVSVEHALYGWAIFTIGYGQYFFDRMLWLFH